MAAGKPTYKQIKGRTLDMVLDTPYDLTGYTVAAELRDGNGDGSLIKTFTTTLETNPATGLLGRIHYKLSASDTDALVPGKTDYAFDTKLNAPNGNTYGIERVWLNITQKVTQ